MKQQFYLNGQVDGAQQQRTAKWWASSLVVVTTRLITVTLMTLQSDRSLRRIDPTLADGVSPIGATQEDEDGDGLPDAWEKNTKSMILRVTLMETGSLMWKSLN